MSRWHLRPSYFGGSTLEGLGVCFVAPPRHSLQADVHILTGERGPARLQWCAARQTAQPDATSCTRRLASGRRRGRTGATYRATTLLSTTDTSPYPNALPLPTGGGRRCATTRLGHISLFWSWPKHHAALFGHQVVIPTSLSHGPYARIGSRRRLDALLSPEEHLVLYQCIITRKRPFLRHCRVFKRDKRAFFCRHPQMARG